MLESEFNKLMVKSDFSLSISFRLKQFLIIVKPELRRCFMPVSVFVAISGIVASFILAISRAIGETMIVSLAAGGKPALTLNPLDAIQTMTAYIVTVSQGETPQGSVEYNSIFAVGLLLFFLTFLMNIFGRFIVTKYAQNYE